ncbi:MAG TPA: C25 family cysteine peptidase [Thermoanaerobaculia bacterium]|nr:C25 family cysteine peptidase [Thermoanaerobaculia bacterium]
MDESCRASSADFAPQDHRGFRLTAAAAIWLALALPAALAAQPCGTPGRDGSGSLTGIVNTYYPGTATASAGATSISVGASSGSAAQIAAGDLLLVIQMQDAAINSSDSSAYGANNGSGAGSTNLNNSGIMEYVTATGPVAAGAVPILGGGNGGKLLNTYTNAAATGTQGQRRFQVIRVPQYANPTLTSGLTALGWTGRVGGVLVIDVDGTLALGGATVSLDQLGFRGGGGQTLDGTEGNGGFVGNDFRVSTAAFPSPGTGGWDASKGEGIAGTPRFVYRFVNGTASDETDNTTEGYPNGSFGRGAPGNAGGGGTDGDNSGSGDTVNESNCGGGGGGNGGAGGIGGNCWNTSDTNGGKGGAAFTASNNPSKAVLGGGAGAGDSNNVGPGHGAPGGGIIIIRGKVSGTGTLTANGVKPCTATATCTNGNGSGQTGSTQDGAGGGGAGGSVLIDACGNATTGLTIHANGGNGGDVNWPDTDQHGPGGGGGGGVVFLSAAGATATVTHGGHGASGNPTSDNLAFGSADGSNGTTTTGAITFPGARPGCTCVVSQAVISSFRTVPAGNAVVLEWETASEAATAGFYVFRVDPATGQWMRLNEAMLAIAPEAPQGGRYRFVDESSSLRERHVYYLVEIESGGRQRTHGPFEVATDWAADPRPELPPDGVFERSAHQPPAALRAAARDAGSARTAGSGAMQLAENANPAAPSPEADEARQSAEIVRATLAAGTAAAAPACCGTSGRSQPAGAAIGNPAALKLYVAAKGIYSLPAATIAAALGLPPAAVTALIAQHRMALTSRGSAIAWQTPKDGSSLRFYGEPADGIYSPENVYWLVPGVAGSAMPVLNGGSPAPAPGPATFTARAHFEQNLFAGTVIAPDPESDYWFWKPTISGDPTYGTQSFPLDLQGLAPGAATATLAVHLQGASAAATGGLAGEHHLRLRVNGAPAGETSWQGITPHDATFSVGQSLLHEGTNNVDVIGVLDPGVPFSISYTNSFDLTYRRLTTTAGSPLVVQPDGVSTVTVSGFASPNLAVFEISNPRSPAVVAGLTVDAAGGANRVSFVPPAPGRTFLAADLTTLPAPRAESWYAPATFLRSAANAADHLIIAPATLADAAAVLAAHRQAQGLVSRVVPLSQIYDEFNDGLASPWAIERFLAYAAGAWHKAPSAVVLAGTGNFDYKNYLGLGGNLVPPLMVRTDDGIFASDSRFLGFPGGERMAIGRLTAATAQDLQGIVAKLTAYESGGTAPWQQLVLMAADSPDSGGQFEFDSDRAAALVGSPFVVSKIYQAQLTPPVAHQQLLSQLGGGAYLLNFIGHAGLDRFSALGLLTSADAAVLANGGKLPVVATASCIVGRFEIPGFQPLAAVLLNNPNGGAAAVWAPSGLTFNAQTSALDRALLPYLLKPGPGTLGAAVIQGMQSFRALGGTSSTLVTYNLFGDPALRLQKPN